jgi:hypothetical protein
VIEILRTGDEPLDLLRAEHDRQAQTLLRIRQILADVAAVQHGPTEEPERTDVRHDGPRSQSPLLEEEQVVAPKVSRSDPIEARARVPAERVHDLKVTPDGRRGVVATHQLVAQPLE